MSCGNYCGVGATAGCVVGGNGPAGGNSVGRGGLGGGAGGGGPCGACKFLRRKCVSGCVFAPHFGNADAGAARFAAVHRVFGASNASKLLRRVPTHRRPQAVRTMCYEAHARLRDPVLGCVSRIFHLQQQVLHLEAELGLIQTRLAALQPPRPPAPEAPHQPSQLAGGSSLSTVLHFDPLQLHPANDAESSCRGQPAQVLQVEHDEVLEELAPAGYFARHLQGMKLLWPDSNLELH